jgi:hypothetical protein
VKAARAEEARGIARPPNLRRRIDWVMDIRSRGMYDILTREAPDART